MKFLADEDVPYNNVKFLRANDADIISILDVQRSLKDKEVLEYAKKEKRILITFDKDFIELVINQNIKSYGIILLRISPKSEAYVQSVLEYLVKEKYKELENTLTIVWEDRIVFVEL